MSALPVLDIQQNSFRIRTENFNSVLSKVGNRPFALISINGATRTGKSFALNYFIRYLTFKTGNKDPMAGAESWTKLTNAPKFVARGGRTRTTLGIDLWSEPFIIQQDGREVAVLVMDCQGLFDDQTTARQNAIIFSLSSLCSSMSIFNLMRNIDESILQQIQFFSGYANLVSRKKEKDSNLEMEMGQNDENPFQRLIFLIRDFDFPDYDYGYHGDINRPTASTNFCRDVFKSSPGVERPPENMFVREEILKSYKDVASFLMPHPGRQFTRDETKPTDEEFEEYMTQFVELVLSPQNLAIKKIGEQEVTGNDFKRFVEEWETLCEKAEDHFPAVQTILESTAIIQNTLALNTASSHYEKGMSSFVQDYPCGLSDSEFLKLHEKLQSEALKIFNNIKKLGGDKLSEQYQKSLVEYIGKVHETNGQLNLILLSKAEMDEELEKNKEKVSQFQDKLNDIESQHEIDLKKQEQVIGDLQRKMDEDSTANAEQRQFYQEQLALAQNNFSQLTQAAEEQKKVFTDQITEMETKFKEKQKQQEEVLKKHQEAMSKLRKEQQESGNLMKILEKVVDVVIGAVTRKFT